MFHSSFTVKTYEKEWTCLFDLLKASLRKEMNNTCQFGVAPVTTSKSLSDSDGDEVKRLGALSQERGEYLRGCL